MVATPFTGSELVIPLTLILYSVDGHQWVEYVLKGWSIFEIHWLANASFWDAEVFENNEIEFFLRHDNIAVDAGDVEQVR